MAWYRDEVNVKRTALSKAQKYEVTLTPGETPQFPGIYKCQSCGFEDVINRECDTMPPCANCREDTEDWKLLVRAEDA